MKSLYEQEEYMVSLQEQEEEMDSWQEKEEDIASLQEQGEEMDSRQEQEEGVIFTVFSGSPTGLLAWGEAAGTVVHCTEYWAVTNTMNTTHSTRNYAND